LNVSGLFIHLSEVDMITFKKSTDIQQLSPTHPAHKIIKRLIQLLIEDYSFHERKHDPTEQGFIILLEGNTDKLEEINRYWHRLQDIEFDGISRINDDYLYGPYIGTDEYALAFVIPSELLPEEMQSQVHDTITL